ncbi:MAG: hypothetical protein AAGG38_04390 [Planctomycetota bacterium]
MSIEFREVRLGEIDEALAFVAGCGTEVTRESLKHVLSLVARSEGQGTLGAALHHVDGGGRHSITVRLVAGVHAGLARLLVDRALRKAESAKVSIAHILLDGEGESVTWSSADWLSRLRPATPVASPAAA